MGQIAYQAIFASFPVTLKVHCARDNVSCSWSHCHSWCKNFDLKYRLYKFCVNKLLWCIHTARTETETYDKTETDELGTEPNDNGHCPLPKSQCNVYTFTQTHFLSISVIVSVITPYLFWMRYLVAVLDPSGVLDQPVGFFQQVHPTWPVLER